MRCDRGHENSQRRRRAHKTFLRLALAVALAVGVAGLGHAASDEDVGIAVALSDLFRAARTVISENQDRINNPDLADKGLSGDVVVERAIAKTIKETGDDPRQADPQSRKGRLLSAMMMAIKGVMAANQDVINRPGIGFKGFVPAIFAREVTEHFRIEAAGLAELKFTAPPELIRNRKALPDDVETEIIRFKFQSPEWPLGKLYARSMTVDGKPASRILVPEYYQSTCLNCHGEPKGEIDITGYPKEGSRLGQLGGIFSFTIYP
jgi:hypothetical protein